MKNCIAVSLAFLCVAPKSVASVGGSFQELAEHFQAATIHLNSDKDPPPFDIRHIRTENCERAGIPEALDVPESLGVLGVNDTMEVFHENVVFTRSQRKAKNGKIGTLFFQTVDFLNSKTISYTACDAFVIPESELNKITVDFPAPFQDYAFGPYWRRLTPPLERGFFSSLFRDTIYGTAPVHCSIHSPSTFAGNHRNRVELSCHKSSGLNLLADPDIRRQLNSYASAFKASAPRSLSERGFLHVIPRQNVGKQGHELRVVGRLLFGNITFPIDFVVVYSQHLQDIFRMSFHSYAFWNRLADRHEKGIYETILEPVLRNYYHSNPF